MAESKRTLILYETMMGNTKKILNEIIEGKARAADVRLAHINEILQEGPGVMLTCERIAFGGPIRKGGPTERMASFAEKYLELLLGKPLALFITCLAQDDAEGQLPGAFSPTLIEHSSLRVCLGGELDLRQLKPFARYAIRMQFGRDPHPMWRNSLGIIRFREFITG